MLITIVCWVYISLLCWSWGKLTLQIFFALEKQDQHTLPFFSLTCFTGLATLCVVAGFLSLFIPLGGWMAQAIILVPSVFLLTRSKIRRSLYQQVTAIKQWPWLAYALIGVSAMLLLVMSSHTIAHPDTLGYHLPIIKWINEYKVIPGLANLNGRFGLQSSWFTVCSIFSFDWAGSQAITFINSSVLFWFFLFIAGQLQARGNHAAWGWLGLLLITLLDFPAIRLTAISASPDFPAALYCWLAFFLFIRYPNAGYSVIALFCLTAVTFKLSVVPILLLVPFLFFRSGWRAGLRGGLSLLLIGIAVTAPFFTRNAISSGYIAFPSAVPDIISADWKLSENRLDQMRHYISYYAKTRTEPEGNAEARNWFVPWLRALNVVNAVILSAVIIAAGLLLIQSFRKRLQHPALVAGWVALAGVLFWFLTAPDPRFVQGFAIPLIGVSLVYGGSRLGKIIGRQFLSAAIAIVTAGIGLYTAYRVVYFLNARELVAPSGAEQVLFTTVKCGEQFFFVPAAEGCGSSPLPCLPGGNCDEVQPRGNKPSDGFRRK